MSRGSANVREDAAEVCGVVQGVDGEDRGSRAGEKGDVEIATLGVGDNPLRIIGTAERVFVQKALVGGDVHAEDVAATGGVVRIEQGEGFLGFERSDLRDGEIGEIDSDLQGREENVARDRLGVAAGCAPGAGLLSGGGEREGENDGWCCEEQRAKAHRYEDDIRGS